MKFVTIPADVLAELGRCLGHERCAICDKKYVEPPCDLVDHLEAHEALQAAAKASR